MGGQKIAKKETRALRAINPKPVEKKSKASMFSMAMLRKGTGGERGAIIASPMHVTITPDRITRMWNAENMSPSRPAKGMLM